MRPNTAEFFLPTQNLLRPLTASLPGFASGAVPSFPPSFYAPGVAPAPAPAAAAAKRTGVLFAFVLGLAFVASPGGALAGGTAAPAGRVLLSVDEPGVVAAAYAMAMGSRWLRLLVVLAVALPLAWAWLRRTAAAAGRHAKSK